MLLADGGDARRRFAARFDGWEFDPVESVVLEQAAALAEVVERLEAIPAPSVAVLRELRQSRQSLVRLLVELEWKDDERNASHAGRQLARARYA